MSDFVLPLQDCVGDAAEVTGGKATGLGRLLEAGLPVPPGFAVTTAAFHAGDGKTLPDEVAAAIDEAYATLGDDVPVAVRSSATAEDAADASFAGQQDTYLWIRGADDVKRHVVRCWGSLFNENAVEYRRKMGYDEADVAMGVVVQEMIDADAAGVALTLDPATGDRETVYLEVAIGLGEGVVRGDVPTDRHWIDKASGEVTRTETSTKDKAHRLEGTEVKLVEIPPLQEAALTDEQAATVGRLAVEIEQWFERPMDIEWAIADGEVALLQARPETVWSRKKAPAPPGEADDWDPLQDLSPPGAHWTTTNFGETAPGVLSPLAWSMWRYAGENAIRGAARAMGAFDEAEGRVPDADDQRYVKAFYGRASLQVEYLAMLGNRMPGTSGQEAVRSLLGEVPDDIDYTPTRERWLHVARKLPVLSVKMPGLLKTEAERTERWWQDAVDRVDTLSRDEARRLFAEGQDRFNAMLELQTTAVVAVVQPLYTALERLCEKTGVGEVTTLSSGYSGFKEVAVVGELWKAAQGETTIDAIVREHGFHGPHEGEVASRVWREEPEILEGLLDEYRNRKDPRERDEELREQRLKLERELLAALPLPARPAARGLLKLCEQRIPLRGVAKRSFLQSIDVARAAARRFGDCLAEDGVLEDREDVFYLTAEEIRGTLPENAAELTALRKARREEYRGLTIPPWWTGDCVPIDPSIAFADDEGVITGVGVSAGVVEGTVRVLESSKSKELQPDEILVAPATDPSWSSIMFISSALVVDIGGALSHASMVARELGIPCVVNTQIGTARLKTGDRVRVDGSRGTVEILTGGQTP